jgi:Holliday junction resolvasome RuvABC endonuclease subunit
MFNIFCDLGTKNFCYLVCSKEDNITTLIDMEIILFKKHTNKAKLITEVIKLISDLVEKYSDSKFFIESQHHNNIKCLKIEYIILTYLQTNNLKFKSVSPKSKFKILDITYTNYHNRKKQVVKYGKELLENSENIINNIQEKIEKLEKLDDFYDCFLMCITEND